MPEVQGIAISGKVEMMDADELIDQCFLAVFRGDLEILKRLLDSKLDSDTQHKLLSGTVKDVRGRTLLHLAVFKQRVEILEMLIDRGATVDSKIESEYSLSVTDDAILLNNEKILKILLQRLLKERELGAFEEYDRLFDKLKTFGHVYLEFKIKLTPRFFLPIGFLLPRENIRAYITDSKIRIDMTIVGFNVTWKYSDHTIILEKHGSEKISYRHILHEKKIYIDKSIKTNVLFSNSKFKQNQRNKSSESEQVVDLNDQWVDQSYVDELVNRFRKTPVMRIDQNLDRIQFRPYKSIFSSIYSTISDFTGFSQKRDPDEEDVIEYNVENISIDLIRMTEHLKMKEGNENLDPNFEKFELMEKQNSLSNHRNDIGEDQYFNDSEFVHKYCSPHIKKSPMKMDIKSWNSKRYLVLLDKFIIPVLELFKEQHYLADEIIKFLKSPKMPGFPMRLQIPIFAITGDFQLKNLFNINNTVQYVRNTGLESCTISPEAFKIPNDYTKVRMREFYSHLKFNMADYMQRFAAME